MTTVTPARFAFSAMIPTTPGMSWRIVVFPGTEKEGGIGIEVPPRLYARGHIRQDGGANGVLVDRFSRRQTFRAEVQDFFESSLGDAHRDHRLAVPFNEI